VVGVTAATTILQTLVTLALPAARAEGCPDAEVIFARGTTEQPGPGPTGEAFIDALRSRLGDKSIGTYAVDYPATLDFTTAVDGIADARAHILATATSCPDTKMVLGGFSQGAAVMGFVTAGVVPDGVDPATVPTPMPPDTSGHIAAVALFGKPSARFMRAIDDPTVTVGPQYVAKTIDLCIADDLVCDPAGRSFSVHDKYFDAGMVDQAAMFAASSLRASWAAAAAARLPDAPHLDGPPIPAAPTPTRPLGPAPGPVITASGPGAVVAPSPLPVV